MTYVGLSTGALHRTSLSLDEVLAINLEAGGDAIELNLLREEQLHRFAPTPRTHELLGKHDYTSMHAPSKGASYGPRSRIPLVLETICRNISVQAVTIHPNDIEDRELLATYEVPWALENLNAGKDVATDPQWFKKVLPGTRYRAVLDLQHAHEHDPTLSNAFALAKVMSFRLTHYHVSGRSEENSHLPVTTAPNGPDILGALSGLPRRPVILEGVWDSVDADMIAEEIQTVRDRLST